MKSNLEEKKFNASSNEERGKQLQSAFFSVSAPIGIMAALGSFLWDPKSFLYGGILTAFIIFFESFTEHYFSFRMSRGIGVLFGSIIGSSLGALFRS